MVKQFHWIPLVGVLVFAGASAPAQGQKGGMVISTVSI